MHTLIPWFIGLVFCLNVATIVVVLKMRRRRDGPPRIIVREVPVIKTIEVPVIREVIREGIVTVIRKPRRIEAEVSDEAMRAWFHLRD